ncbi:NAC domain-containing protein 72 [Nymphaea thermarum]|nr:NAC domain-containing protein 72 [Nymphaea thermarum]
MEGTGDQIYLPPGFRFHPTDEELLVQYLLPKTSGLSFSSNVPPTSLQTSTSTDTTHGTCPVRSSHPPLISFLPRFCSLPLLLYCLFLPVTTGKAFFGDNELYFFSQRDRKFPNGLRLNRGAGSGFWKATGTNKTIVVDSNKVGTKKALVCYVGKPPNGSKTNWIMHEYQLLLDDNGCLPQKKATPCVSDHPSALLSLEIQVITWHSDQLAEGNQSSKQHDEGASSPLDEETFASLSASGDQRSESNVNQWTAVPEMNTVGFLLQFQFYFSIKPKKKMIPKCEWITLKYTVQT